MDSFQGLLYAAHMGSFGRFQKYIALILFAVINIFFQKGFAEERKSPRCEFEDTGYSFIPKTHCKDLKFVLDSLGCLDADGSVSKHCKKETWCHSKCESSGVEKYACRDFKICVNEPNHLQKDKSKRPRPEFEDELTRSVR